MSGRARTGAVPDLVPPMQPSAGSGQPPTGPDWVVELAWTGHRCVAYVEPGRRVRLLSAHDVSMTAAYPELAVPLQERSPTGGMVLDGTLVARGEEHAERPRLLARRSARVRPSAEHIASVPVDFQVADLLWLDGHSTVELPYRDRRTLLDGLCLDAAPVWSTSPLPMSELGELLRVADVKGVDALHARHLGARYRPGGRSPLWLRLPVPRTRRVVVGGWSATDPARPDGIASLLLGVPGPDGLRYVGRVGVPGEERRRVAALRALHRDRSPFAGDLPVEAARHAIWVEPRLVAEVHTAGPAPGGRLRLPRWRGWRGEQPLPVEVAPEVAAPEVAAPAPPPSPAEERRLEQHFVYNSLNTIAALIRTDPGRARELLYGFADLSRAADRPGTTTLGAEVDSVRGYLALEQARFGSRLRVALDVEPGTEGVPVAPLALLALVREAVQGQVEPRPDGGHLRVEVRRVAGGVEVAVTGPADLVRLLLPAEDGVPVAPA